MRKIFMSLSVLFSALFTGACSAAPAPEVPADAIWLDVRTEKEFAEKSIPGSILIPHEKIPAEAKEKLPDKNKTIAVYCRSGRRSAIARKSLEKLGYSKIIDLGAFENAREVYERSQKQK